MLINNVIINSYRSLNSFLKSNEIKNVVNIEDLNKILNISFDNNQLHSLLILLKNENKEKLVLRYIKKCNKNNFSIETFLKYKNFIINRPENYSAKEILKIIHGDEFEEKYKKICSKKSTPYMVEYWVTRGYNILDSETKIIEYKNKKVTSLDGFISRHGKIKGTEMFQNFKETSKHTLSKYIKKYGEIDGLVKWNKYLSTKDSNSYNWAIKKCDGDILVTKQTLIERKRSVSTNLDYFINKYGEVDGNYLYKINNEKKDSSSYKYFLNKTNGDTEKAEFLYKEFSLKKDSNSFNYFLKKVDGDIKKAELLYNNNIKKRIFKFGQASKESLKILKPLYDKLLEKGYDNNDLKLGINGSHELMLRDDNGNTFFYDFTIKSKKLIIEFHGHNFHPDYKNNSITNLEKNFKHPFKIELSKLIEKEIKKEKAVEINGYKLLIIWSNVDIKENKMLINKFLKENGVEYEN